MITDLKAGTRRVGAVAAIAGAASVLLYQISNFANQVGTKSVKIKKLIVYNNGAGNQAFTIGTGAAGAYAAMTPQMLAINNIENVFTEDQLPVLEWTADMYIQVPGWAAGALAAQVEVEEIG